MVGDGRGGEEETAGRGEGVAAGGAEGAGGADGGLRVFATQNKRLWEGWVCATLLNQLVFGPGT